MKKTLMLACLAATAFSSITMDANATAVCAGGSGASIAVTGGTNFIKQNFTVQCSANVFSNYSENTVALGVVAGSSKGKNFFGGGTNGGGVTQRGTCATTGCSTTEISDTNSAARRDGS